MSSDIITDSAASTGEVQLDYFNNRAKNSNGGGVRPEWRDEIRRKDFRFFLPGLLEIPAYGLAILVLLKYGRRVPYSMALILAGTISFI